MPARTSRKVEILEQGKNFSGQCYVKLNRAVLEVGNAVNRQSAACKESAIQLYNLILKPIIFNNNIIQMIIN